MMFILFFCLSIYSLSVPSQLQMPFFQNALEPSSMEVEVSVDEADKVDSNLLKEKQAFLEVMNRFEKSLTWDSFVPILDSSDYTQLFLKKYLDEGHIKSFHEILGKMGRSFVSDLYDSDEERERKQRMAPLFQDWLLKCLLVLSSQENIPFQNLFLAKVTHRLISLFKLDAQVLAQYLSVPIDLLDIWNDKNISPFLFLKIFNTLFDANRFCFSGTKEQAQEIMTHLVYTSSHQLLFKSDCLERLANFFQTSFVDFHLQNSVSFKKVAIVKKVFLKDFLFHGLELNPSFLKGEIDYFLNNGWIDIEDIVYCIEYQFIDQLEVLLKAVDPLRLRTWLIRDEGQLFRLFLSDVPEKDLKGLLCLLPFLEQSDFQLFLDRRQLLDFIFSMSSSRYSIVVDYFIENKLIPQNKHSFYLNSQSLIDDIQKLDQIMDNLKTKRDFNDFKQLYQSTRYTHLFVEKLINNQKVMDDFHFGSIISSFTFIHKIPLLKKWLLEVLEYAFELNNLSLTLPLICDTLYVLNFRLDIPDETLKPYLLCDIDLVDLWQCQKNSGFCFLTLFQLFSQTNKLFFSGTKDDAQTMASQLFFWSDSILSLLYASKFESLLFYFQNRFGTIHLKPLDSQQSPLTFLIKTYMTKPLPFLEREINYFIEEKIVRKDDIFYCIERSCVGILNNIFFTFDESQLKTWLTENDGELLIFFLVYFPENDLSRFLERIFSLTRSHFNNKKMLNAYLSMSESRRQIVEPYLTQNGFVLPVEEEVDELIEVVNQDFHLGKHRHSSPQFGLKEVKIPCLDPHLSVRRQQDASLSFPLARASLAQLKKKKASNQVQDQTGLPVYTNEELLARPILADFKKTLSVTIEQKNGVSSSYSPSLEQAEEYQVLASNSISRVNGGFYVHIQIESALNDLATLANLSKDEYEHFIDLILLNELIQATDSDKKDRLSHLGLSDEQKGDIEAGSLISAIVSLSNQRKVSVSDLFRTVQKIVHVGKDYYSQEFSVPLSLEINRLELIFTLAENLQEKQSVSSHIVLYSSIESILQSQEYKAEFKEAGRTVFSILSSS